MGGLRFAPSTSILWRERARLEFTFWDGWSGRAEVVWFGFDDISGGEWVGFYAVGVGVLHVELVMRARECCDGCVLVVVVVIFVS